MNEETSTDWLGGEIPETMYYGLDEFYLWFIEEIYREIYVNSRIRFRLMV